MTIKRLILVVLTIFAIAKVSLSLVESWGQPQIQSRLELYQTSLLLHASEWQGKDTNAATPQESTTDLTTARNALIGAEPLKAAQKQYQEARQSAQTTQSTIAAQLKELSSQQVAIAPDVAKPELALVFRLPISCFDPASGSSYNESFSQVEKAD
jgi:hypothetical protein